VSAFVTSGAESNSAAYVNSFFFVVVGSSNGGLFSTSVQQASHFHLSERQYQKCVRSIHEDAETQTLLSLPATLLLETRL
jgi:hypothetical protein